MSVESVPRRIGRYEIDGLLGRGGMGAVYSAHDPAIGRPVALKLVSEGFGDPRARERLAHEARAAGRLQHPNIVTIFDVGEHDGQLFIVMERVLGEPMSSMLLRRPRLLDLSTGLLLIEEACGALAYAHQMGIVHLDIKPDNLMVDQSGRIKILDFGIAHVGGDDATRTSSILGSLRYMAPEQLTSGAPLDQRCDVFAMGCILYELVAGAPAFEARIKDAVARVLGDDPRPLVEAIPGTDPDLSALAARMMSRDPKGRLSALAEVGRELAVIRSRLAGHPVVSGVASPNTASTPTRPLADAEAPKRRVPATLSISIVLVLMAVALAWFYPRPPAPATALRQQDVVETESPTVPGSSPTSEAVASSPPPVERRSGSDTPTVETAPAAVPARQARRADASRDRTATDTSPATTSAIAGSNGNTPSATTPPAARNQDEPPVSASLPEPRPTADVGRDTLVVAPPAPSSASLGSPTAPAVGRGAPGQLPTLPTPISDEARVLAVLDRYKKAFEERRPDVLADVFPSLTDEQRSRLRRDLSAVDRYVIEFANTRVSVRGEMATVTAVVTREMQPRVGGLQRNSTPTEFHLHKVGEEWIIDGIVAR